MTTFFGFGAKKYESMLLQKSQNLLDQDFNITNATPEPYALDGCLPKNYLKLISKSDGQQLVRKVIVFEIVSLKHSNLGYWRLGSMCF